MKKLNELVKEGKWTEFLNEMPIGKAIPVLFPDKEALKSCANVAYAGYGNLGDYGFSFVTNGNMATVTKFKRKF